jgi:hypothetical protein
MLNVRRSSTYWCNGDKPHFELPERRFTLQNTLWRTSTTRATLESYYEGRLYNVMYPDGEHTSYEGETIMQTDDYE